MKIKQAIIPAAGLGSRFLPITKTVPKELLPLLDRPCLQQVVDEAIEAGVEEFVIIISEEKRMIESYFSQNRHLDQWLLKRDKTDLYQQVKAIENKAKFHFVIQDQPLGLGHAVLCAKQKITEPYFFVILPDDIVISEVAVCRQMNEVFSSNNNTPLLAVMEVPWDDVHRYGIVEAAPLSDRQGMIKSIVEKPSRQEAPSNLAVIGRYLLPKEIFSLLEKTKPGSGGEIQLTDALRELMSQRGLNSFAFVGERYDTGTPLGLLQASVGLSLKEGPTKNEMAEFIKGLASVL